MADIDIDDLKPEFRRKLFTELLEVLPVDEIAELIRLTLLSHEVEKIRNNL